MQGDYNWWLMTTCTGQPYCRNCMKSGESIICSNLCPQTPLVEQPLEIRCALLSQLTHTEEKLLARRQGLMETKHLNLEEMRVSFASKIEVVDSLMNTELTGDVCCETGSGKFAVQNSWNAVTGSSWSRTRRGTHIRTQRQHLQPRRQ